MNVRIMNILEVDASSEEDAIKRIKQQLVASKQIKENDPVEITVVSESK